jgi:hypothetical protein
LNYSVKCQARIEETSDSEGAIDFGINVTCKDIVACITERKAAQLERADKSAFQDITPCFCLDCGTVLSGYYECENCKKRHVICFSDEGEKCVILKK